MLEHYVEDWLRLGRRHDSAHFLGEVEDKVICSESEECARWESQGEP